MSISLALPWLKREARAKPLDGFQPGDWQDRLIFGYMFRVITGLAACLAPIALLLIWGALNGWRLTDAMVTVFGVLAGLLIVMGEWLRMSVYETRVRDARRARLRDLDDAADLSREIIEIYGELSPSYRFAKRAFDIVLSVMMIVLLLPLLLMISLIIRFDSSGPILFATQRIGYRGRLFRLLKFRTMRTDAVDANDHRDNRVTRVGRFLRRTSLDELPQLLNVLWGDMSLVGPRPPLLAAVGRAALDQHDAGSVDPRVEIVRFAKPGLTGIATVGEPMDSTLATYLQKRSMRFDLQILLRTWYFVMFSDFRSGR